MSRMAYLPEPSTSPNFTMFEGAILYSCSSFTSGGSSSGFRSSSVKRVLLGQHQHVERRPRSDGREPDLSRALGEDEVAAALQMRAGHCRSAASVLAVDLDTRKSCSRSNRPTRTYRWYVPGSFTGTLAVTSSVHGHIQGGVVEEPGLAGSARRSNRPPEYGEKVGRGHDDSAGQLVRRVVVAGVEGLLGRQTSRYSRKRAQLRTKPQSTLRHNSSEPNDAVCSGCNPDRQRHGRTPLASSNSGVTSTGIEVVAARAVVRAGRHYVVLGQPGSAPSRSPSASNVSSWRDRAAMAAGIARSRWRNGRPRVASALCLSSRKLNSIISARPWASPVPKRSGAEDARRHRRRSTSLSSAAGQSFCCTSHCEEDAGDVGLGFFQAAETPGLSPR